MMSEKDYGEEKETEEKNSLHSFSLNCAFVLNTVYLINLSLHFKYSKQKDLTGTHLKIIQRVHDRSLSNNRPSGTTPKTF